MNNDNPQWLSLVREKVESLRYGVVQLVVQDSKVIQIEHTERTRLESPGSAKSAGDKSPGKSFSSSHQRDQRKRR